MTTTTETTVSTLANDLVNATAKVPAKKPPVKKAHKVWRLDKTPSGKQLFTYMLAILKLEGGFTAGRKVMNPKNVSKRFDTNTAVSYHKGLGRFADTKTGIRLTVAGWNYFNGRVNGKTPAQAVIKSDIDILVKALRTGKMPEKAAVFATDTKFRQVTVK